MSIKPNRCFMADRTRPLGLAQDTVWIMTLITCPVETLIAYRLLRGEIGVSFAVAVHFLVLISIAAQVFLLMKRGKDLRNGLLLLCFTFGLGPAGGVAAFFVTAMTLVFERNARPFEE